MPFSLVPTPVLELILNESDNDKAIAEYRRLRDVHCHLLTHFVAVKTQTEASHAGLKSLIGEVEPHPAPHFPRRLLE